MLSARVVLPSTVNRGQTVMAKRGALGAKWYLRHMGRAT